MNKLDAISANAEKLLKELSPHVTLLAAAKTRSPEEIQAAWQAGICCFGHNYVQEAQQIIPQLTFKAEWHMIGHLQRNKVTQALSLFDMVESVDSVRLINELEKRCAQQERVLPVLIEVNSGCEQNKSGVLPGEVEEIAAQLRNTPHLILRGLMTIGPLSGDAQQARPFFRVTREIFERLRKENPNISWLSMGMSHSYQVAIEEGANMVRIGTSLFGPRG